ncbi:MAG: c-type cytochrome [Archangium sp.]
MTLRKLALLCCVSFAACEGEVVGEPMIPSVLDSGVVTPMPDAGIEQPQEETGELLYKQRCASCHGATGEGSELAYQIRSPVRAYATWVVRNGRNERTFSAGMEPISTASLSDVQLNKVFDYLHAVDMPADGQGLYRRFCGNCHGLHGEGGRSDEDIIEKALEDPEEIDEAIREGHGRNKFDDAEEYMPAWRNNELTPVQVQAITEYLKIVSRRHVEPEEEEEDDEDEEEEDDEDEEEEDDED